MDFFRHKIANWKTVLTVRVAAILLIILAIYHQDLSLLANEITQSEITSYMLVIPVFFIYLIYRKRKMLRSAISFEISKARKTVSFEDVRPHRSLETYFNQIIGTLLCLIAFLLYWHGSYTFYPLEYHMISMPMFIAGVVLVMFNKETLKVLAFPLALLVFLTPPPQEILNAIGSSLSIISSESAYVILKAAGFPVALTSRYGTPIIMLSKSQSTRIFFTIDVACAGFYSLLGFLVFALFIAYIAKAELPKKAIFFLVGIPLMLALNIARIILIVLIGNQFGKETALQIFHLMGGWVLILAGSVILAIVSEKILKIHLFTAKRKTSPCYFCNPHSDPKQDYCAACGRLLNPLGIRLTKRDFGKIFALIIISILIINIQVPVFAITEGPVELNTRSLSGIQVTTQMLPKMPGYTRMFAYRDKSFEELAEQDASLIYVYYSNDTSKKSVWAIIELAKTKTTMHPWEVCLITWQLAHGYQPQVTKLSQRDIHVLENPPITARYFSFLDHVTDLAQVVLYWYESSFFNTGSSMEREYAKISFVAYAQSPEEISDVEDQLLPFGKAMVDHWLPIKSWSLVALLLSQNGSILIAMATALLAIMVAYQLIKNERRKKLNLKAYNKLVSQEEKLILQAASKAGEETMPTGSAIARTYEKLAEKPVTPSALFHKLSRAEEAGFVKRCIASQDDEPILVWKTETQFFKPFTLKNLIRKISCLFRRKTNMQSERAIRDLGNDKT